MWPSVVMAEAKASNWLALGAGLGVTYYVLGLPSTDESLLSLAQWYLETGAIVVGAKMLMPGASSAIASP